MKYLIIAAILAAGPAFADLDIRFVEGAPKDRFTLTQTGGCALGPSKITIDLAGSAAGLIFDVTATGAGVEVFQPFELTAGAAQVETLPVVADGDTKLTLALSGLADGQSVAFTIDVDDTLGSRAITVSGAEIEGASVHLANNASSVSATFDQTARAKITVPDCTS